MYKYKYKYSKLQGQGRKSNKQQEKSQNKIAKKMFDNFIEYLGPKLIKKQLILVDGWMVGWMV